MKIKILEELDYPEWILVDYYEELPNKVNMQFDWRPAYSVCKLTIYNETKKVWELFWILNGVNWFYDGEYERGDVLRILDYNLLPSLPQKEWDAMSNAYKYLSKRWKFILIAYQHKCDCRNRQIEIKKERVKLRKEDGVYFLDF